MNSRAPQDGDTRSTKGFSSPKFREGSPPPVGEMLKGEEGIDTLLPLAKDTYGKKKKKRKSGVTPPETVEARGEPGIIDVYSTCSV